ncbi:MULTISPECIES: YjzC family protein [Gracilibacillus]|uniref:YjzC family protein n=1 Tax=Gracilibacillus dipsosauri TaxID=178340 RepID=A0A317L0L4_9BACI|nr:YjzC family protein [Gracilibacillus dipsosauri]PWU68784.1 YjzC family protein [Gracilibacillus dipsosauri]
MANKQTYKTGEKAPESGLFKIDSLVNEGSTNEGDTEIRLEEGEQFPPSPSSNKAVNWVKA